MILRMYVQGTRGKNIVHRQLAWKINNKNNLLVCVGLRDRKLVKNRAE